MSSTFTKSTFKYRSITKKLDLPENLALRDKKNNIYQYPTCNTSTPSPKNLLAATRILIK